MARAAPSIVSPCTDGSNTACARRNWSWSLSGLVSEARTNVQDHARRIEVLEAARAANREILQRQARLEEALAHLRAG